MSKKKKKEGKYNMTPVSHSRAHQRQHAVDSYAKCVGITVSAQALGHWDALLAFNREAGLASEEIRATLIGAGVFLGEVIRRTLDGRWVEDKDGLEVVEVQTDVGPMACNVLYQPWKIYQKNENSLVNFYETAALVAKSTAVLKDMRPGETRQLPTSMGAEVSLAQAV